MTFPSATRTVFLFLIVVTGLGVGAALADGIALHVRTVLATDSGSELDPRLDGCRRQLAGLFRYSSYRLVKEEERHVAFGSPNSFEIPGGRFLQIMPMAFKGDRVKLKVVLIEGANAPQLDTDFSLPNRGSIWVGGPRHPDGTLLISIGAEAAQ